MSEESLNETAIEDEVMAEQEPVVEAEAGDEPQPEKTKRSWPVAVLSVIGILLLCCVLAVCVSAAIAAFSGGRATPLPPPATSAPDQPTAAAPTATPATAYLEIASPVQGETVPVDQSFTVSGVGANLHEAPIIIQALDWQGNVLDEKETILQGRDVGTGGERMWQVELKVQTEPGTAGKIVAFSRSPENDRVTAEAQVEVSLGRTPSVQAYLRIDQPAPGAVLDIDNRVQASGSGAGLPEGNVVVQAIDAGGNVLAQEVTILQGSDVGAGGEGTWSVQLKIQTEPGTPGKILAFSPSPVDNTNVAEASVDVAFGQAPAVEPFLMIGAPAADTVLDIEAPIEASGTGGGLHEGNVVVQAIDANGAVLDEQATTLQGPDVAIGGEGTWSVQLNVQTQPGTAGKIVAFSPNPVSGGNDATATVDVVFGEETSASLEGVNWLLDGTLLGSEITAYFEKGQVSGAGGCNTYSGAYAISSSSPDNVIRISNLTIGQMACDEDVMDQEARYLSALQAATRYLVEGTQLTIYYPGGRLVYSSQ